MVITPAHVQDALHHLSIALQRRNLGSYHFSMEFSELTPNIIFIDCEPLTPETLKETTEFGPHEYMRLVYEGEWVFGITAPESDYDESFISSVQHDICRNIPSLLPAFEAEDRYEEAALLLELKNTICE